MGEFPHTTVSLESLPVVLDAVERFLHDEQATIDVMLIFAQHGLGERPLTTALIACGDLDVSWQREQAYDALTAALDHILHVVDGAYGEDWDDPTRLKFDELTTRARHAMDALVDEM